MNTRRLVLLFVVTLLLVGNTVQVSAAPYSDIIEETDWPDCGNHAQQAFSDYLDSNLSIEADWSRTDSQVDVKTPKVMSIIEGPVVTVKSFNGWEITAIEIFPQEIVYTYPAGTTIATPTPKGSVSRVTVQLYKDCDAPPPPPKFTGRYVYTLLGNFPCNLVGFEIPIPARFLNPEYTAALCGLPGLPHDWNGKWVKNKEMDHGGYLTGGQYYDTSQGNLP